MDKFKNKKVWRKFVQWKTSLDSDFISLEKLQEALSHRAGQRLRENTPCVQKRVLGMQIMVGEVGENYWAQERGDYPHFTHKRKGLNSHSCPAGISLPSGERNCCPLRNHTFPTLGSQFGCSPCLIPGISALSTGLQSGHVIHSGINTWPPPEREKFQGSFSEITGGRRVFCL